MYIRFSDTLYILKYLSFDFFYINFDHLFYSKYFKNIKNKYRLKIYYIINHIIIKIKIILNFLIRQVVKNWCKKVKHQIFGHGRTHRGNHDRLRSTLVLPYIITIQVNGIGYVNWKGVVCHIFYMLILIPQLFCVCKLSLARLVRCFWWNQPTQAQILNLI
jgi:hypothetical protein